MVSSSPKNSLLVLAIAVTMVTVSMPAMASHNSVGANGGIAIADEVNDEGELIPDIPENSPMSVDYHTHLDTPRDMPEDQSGSRYTDCTKAGDTSQEAYLEGLKDGDSCYIGFMDAQFEYLAATTLLLVQQSDFVLYPANPAPDDDFCQDPQNRVEPECSGSNHDWYITSSFSVDTDLLDEPFQGNSQGNSGAMATGVSDVTGTHPGSGTLTLPLLQTPYLYLFGQPHPDTPEENRTNLAAGEGVFGPDPAAGGSPLTDISGACGDRTLDCELLSPKDIVLYDDNDDNLGDVEGAGDRARVCDYRPQFVTLNPDGRSAGLCGVFGDLYNSFIGEAEKGGLGIPGAPGTWHQVQPGWYEGVLMIIGGEPDTLVAVADEFQCASDVATPAVPGVIGSVGVMDGDDCDGEYGDDIQQFSVVNPKVPKDTHPLWCVRPNFLATGDDVAGVGDPGLYGTYQAHGIDSDIYRLSAFDAVYKDVIDATHSTVRGALGPVETAVEDTQDTVDELTEDAELPDDVQQALDEAADRATYTETNEDPVHVEPWTRERSPGIACDALGLPQAFSESTTLDGDTIFDVQFQQSTVSLKDPTLTSDGLPAGESETTEGAWMAEQYSFGGTALSFLDTSQDAEHGDEEADFSGCASANGQPQPNNDFCTWEALWDAYNPECTDIDNNECGTLLEDMGYDLEAGVGLHFAWKVSGPVIVSDEDATANVPPRPNEITGRTAVLGLNDPTAQNCIVGFSIGLADRVDADQIVEDACGDVSGETFVIEDAFNDQSGVNPGSFSAAIDVTKLVPTPSAVVDATEVGAGDELCVTGVWNVDGSVGDGIADDTEDSIEFGATDNPNGWTTCRPMESTVDA